MFVGLPTDSMLGYDINKCYNFIFTRQNKKNPNSSRYYIFSLLMYLYLFVLYKNEPKVCQLCGIQKQFRLG